MNADAWKDLLAVLTAFTGLGTAALGMFKYFNYRSHKDRMDAVGTRFASVIEALSSKDDVKRRAAAIMLRRFFDPGTEFGAAGTPYRNEAVNVIAAILREERTGSFQKLLADGLWYARSLRHADLQKTNLQGAYLGARGDQPIDLRHADFFRADLSAASLKRALAQGAIFYQARLVDTVFSGADLRGANFFEADLRGARFVDARLDGASFAGARDLPADVARHLDADGVWQSRQAQAPALPGDDVAARDAPPRVFFSRPAHMRTAALEAAAQLQRQLAQLGRIELVELGRDDYPRFGALAAVRQRVGSCVGMVVLGVGELEVSAGMWRAGTSEERALQGVQWPSAWTQIEAGIAIGMGLPLLLVAAAPLDCGIFAPDADGHAVFRLSAGAQAGDPAVHRVLDDWHAAVRERAAHCAAQAGSQGSMQAAAQ